MKYLVLIILALSLASTNVSTSNYETDLFEIESESIENESIISEIINQRKSSVENEIGVPDETLWDSIEMESLYHVYKSHGFAIVYEDYEVTDQSSIEYIELLLESSVHKINYDMSIESVTNILGSSEWIDYEFWHHESSEPIRWIKLEYSFDEYTLKIYFDFESQIVQNIRLYPNSTESICINNELLEQLFEMEKEAIKNRYNYTEATYLWSVRNANLGEKQDLAIDMWIHLLDADLLVGFSGEHVKVIRILGQYNLNGIIDNNSINQIKSKLENERIKTVINRSDHTQYNSYYIEDLSSTIRIKYISEYYPNQNELEVFVYKN